MREWHQDINRAQDILDHLIRCIEIIRRDEFPDLVKVG
jgi:hypothetical protein